MTRKIMLGGLCALTLLTFTCVPRTAAQDALPPELPLPKLDGIPPELQKEFEEQLQKMQARQLQAIRQLQEMQQRQRGNFAGFDRSGVRWGGARLTTVSPTMQEKLGLPENEGMVASAIDADSPAEKAGLKVNDVLVKINNKPVPSDDLNVLAKLVEEQDPTKGVDLVVIRDGKEETLKGTKMPALSTTNSRGERGIFKNGKERRGGAGGFPGFPRVPGMRGGINVERGMAGNLQMEIMVNGARVSRKQAGDQFSGEYAKDDLKINVAGKVENGQPKFAEIVVQHGAESKKYTDLAEVPAQDRLLIEQMLLPATGTISIPMQMPTFPNFPPLPDVDP